MRADIGALGELSARLAEITGDASPTIVVADHRGLITFIDERLVRALGWRADELVGRSLSTLVPVRFRDAHHIGFSRFLTTGEGTLLERPLTLSISTRSGKELRCQHVITALRTGDSWLFAAAIKMEGADDH